MPQLARLVRLDERMTNPSLNLPSPYPIREFGLFGKLKGGDYMIGHPLIEKDSAVTLERRAQLIF